MARNSFDELSGIKMNDKDYGSAKFDHFSDDLEVEYREPFLGKILQCLGTSFAFIGTYFCCGCCCYPYKVVQKGQKGVIQRFGQVQTTVAEGLHYVNPMT